MDAASRPRRARAAAPPRAAVALATLGLGAASIAGCTENPGLGLQAAMRVEGGEFRTGDLPAPAGGPEVVAITLTTSKATAGERDRPLSLSLGPESTVAAIGLEGDAGYWLVPAGAPLVEAPEYPAVSARLSFSPGALPAEYNLFAAAGDGLGRFGKRASVPLAIEAPPPPEGELVVSLLWDTEADLDLHVVDPDGVEIWKRNINSYEPPPPGEPVDPSAWKTGALLDFDSNAACVIDGRRRENVIWKEAPPKGQYTVRADTFSLCEADSARWSVVVYRGGEAAESAQGTSTEADTRAPHDRGAGVLALAFEVP